MPRFFSGFEGALQIVDQIVRIFQSDGQTNRALRDACACQRFIRHAKVRGAGRVNHQAAAVADIRQVAEDFERFNKSLALCTAAFQVKTED